MGHVCVVLRLSEVRRSVSVCTCIGAGLYGLTGARLWARPDDKAMGTDAGTVRCHRTPDCLV